MSVASLIVLSVGVFVASAALTSWWLAVTWGAAVKAAPPSRRRPEDYGARVAIPAGCVLALVYTIVFIGLWLGLLALGVPAALMVIVATTLTVSAVALAAEYWRARYRHTLEPAPVYVLPALLLTPPVALAVVYLAPLAVWLSQIAGA